MNARTRLKIGVAARVMPMLAPTHDGPWPDDAILARWALNLAEVIISEAQKMENAGANGYRKSFKKRTCETVNGKWKESVDMGGEE